LIIFSVSNLLKSQPGLRTIDVPWSQSCHPNNTLSWIRFWQMSLWKPLQVLFPRILISIHGISEYGQTGHPADMALCHGRNWDLFACLSIGSSFRGRTRCPMSNDLTFISTRGFTD
jgi:hypothetical protein